MSGLWLQSVMGIVFIVTSFLGGGISTHLPGRWPPEYPMTMKVRIILFCFGAFVLLLTVVGVHL
jgi:hypothetical protein